MENEDFNSAFRYFVELVRRHPGFTLAYYKCALCLLELQLVSTQYTTYQQRLYQFDESLHFFRCAGKSNLYHYSLITPGKLVALEPMNRYLLANIDFALRLHTGMEVDLTGKGLPSLYRHHALFPKALSDAIVFARLERRLDKNLNSEEFQ